ncbi:TIGR04222 domain-containing membrane protein [Kitasatospora sp. NPDC097605]|uniref:TIGR04222 domain-containing membrane protein n=1 Tax=Kitasatospora sp. NPDC097605 TaxID=3157226 RepID=UPI00331E8BC1
MGWIVVLAVAGALTAVGAFRLRRAHRAFVDAPVVPRAPGEELTVYEVAYLHRGERTVARTVLASMVLGGRVSVADGAVTVVDPLARDTVEAEVVRVFERVPRRLAWRRAWRRMERLSRAPGLTAVGRRLGDQGLVVHPARRRAAELAADQLTVIRMASFALGVAAVWMVAARGFPDPLVPGVATFLLVVAGWRSTTHWTYRSGGTTETGRAALAAHKEHHQQWRPRIHDALDDEDAELLGKATQDELHGRLGALRKAISPRPYTPPPFEDPPGLGGL